MLSTTNNNDLQLNSLFTLASAQAEDGEDGEGTSPQGRCEQKENVTCDREVQTNGYLPDGVYAVKTTSKDCWRGTETQCESGQKIVTSNILGVEVDSKGSFTSKNCYY